MADYKKQGGVPMHTAIVVDDEPITRMDLSDMLREQGFSVVGEASDGFDAIELCRSLSPDVVLMDIRMPVFDGLSASETILSEELAGCVVLLTAFSSKELVERANQIGVTGYLVKPVEERLLLPTIEVALAQSLRLRTMREENRTILRQMEESKLVERAKIIIAKEKGISESEAYSELRQLSMNKRC
ncbi:MAG: response regulator, partial [Angelakisella sp.]